MDKEDISRFKSRIDETLSAVIPKDSTFSQSLYEGGKYALLAPGKRIRPLLTVCTAEMLMPGSIEQALIPACAVELVHTYSLIHDDLPCMDNDDFRRGKPTVHRVYTEAHAVLIGDYLLTYAFETLATAPLLDPKQKVDLIKKLAVASGGEGMIGGQIMDIEKSAHIDELHARKTAALFCAAIEFGGIITQCPPSILDLLKDFGIKFGKLFQIIDDILDGDHPLGMEKAQELATTLYQETLTTLDRFPFNTIALKKVTELISDPWKKFLPFGV